MDGFEQKNLTEDAELDIFVRTHIFLMGRKLEINDVNHEVVEIYQSRLQLFCFVAVVKGDGSSESITYRKEKLVT